MAHLCPFSKCLPLERRNSVEQFLSGRVPAATGPANPSALATSTFHRALPRPPGRAPAGEQPGTLLRCHRCWSARRQQSRGHESRVGGGGFLVCPVGGPLAGGGENVTADSPAAGTRTPAHRVLPARL